MLGINTPKGVLTYSPADTLVVVGAFPITTFETIEVEPISDRHVFYEGIYGELCSCKSRSTLATITIVLPQTTIYNDLLSLIHFVTLYGYVPVIVKTLLATDLHVMPKAKCIKMPGNTIGKSPKDRSWVFKGKMPINYIGGNLSGNIMNVINHRSL